ncbi:hypothetical protein llap_15581 [Limosa lapponica baueri]|uniref:Uncharacterized protein n=1 Tax=Limosa lapponica baueri TaxID=1758121 RepID=A0A2I0TJY0_LIMLA|nr:hypothetical protein llap_15581 [Limosa lapponica baueri]
MLEVKYLVFCRACSNRRWTDVISTRVCNVWKPLFGRTEAWDKKEKSWDIYNIPWLDGKAGYKPPGIGKISLLSSDTTVVTRRAYQKIESGKVLASLELPSTDEDRN